MESSYSHVAASSLKLVKRATTLDAEADRVFGLAAPFRFEAILAGRGRQYDVAEVRLRPRCRGAP